MKRIRIIWFQCVVIFTSLHLSVLNGQIDTVCFNDTILYEIPGTLNLKYNWDISGGTIIYSSEKMDSVIVVWTETGLHSVEIFAQSVNACNGAERRDVFVYKPSIDLGQDINICEGGSEIIEFNPSYVEYWWNNEPGTNEFVVNTNGTITLEVKDHYGCWSKDHINVITRKNPVPEFTVHVDSVNRSVFLNNLSDSLYKYHWDFGDGSYSDIYNPESHRFFEAGIYEISLTATNNKCSETILHEVIFPEQLKSDFEFTHTGCAPLEVGFINRSVNADTYYWDFGNGEISSVENPKTIYENPGIYKVSLIVKNNGSEDILKRNIIVKPAPTANFEASTDESFTFDEINFRNNSSNATRYLWDFGDGESSEVYEPTHHYSSLGEYDISLQVWSENGCSDSLLVQKGITIVQDCRLLFPTGFVPDKSGPSGGYYYLTKQEDNNTIFHPLHRNIDEYELRIYNRWGEMVFISRDINIGWDGYYKQKLAPQDTYLYIVKSKCSMGKEISTTGSITLIY